ncbi:hypothetical protein FORC31_p408 (plasmid) [Escherichia coli]|nr:hypothetical protein FORC31_p408 [Escherichia coli]
MRGYKYMRYRKEDVFSSEYRNFLNITVLASYKKILLHHQT